LTKNKFATFNDTELLFLMRAIDTWETDDYSSQNSLVDEIGKEFINRGWMDKLTNAAKTRLSKAT